MFVNYTVKSKDNEAIMDIFDSLVNENFKLFLSKHGIWNSYRLQAVIMANKKKKIILEFNN